MEKAEYVERFKEVAEFFGFAPDEYQAFKILCLGNKDAAQKFVIMMSERVRRDVRFGINERMQQSIAAENNAGKFRT